MSSALFVLAVAAAVFPQLPSDAAPAPPPPATSSDEVIVTEERGGPGLWRIRDGDTEIYVLPTVNFLPRGFVWNDRPVARILARSDSLLTTVKVEASAGDKARLAGAMFRTMTVDRGRIYMPKGETLATHVGPDLAEEFARAAARVEARLAAMKSQGKAENPAEETDEPDEAAIEKARKDADPSRRHPFFQANALWSEAAKSAGLRPFEAEKRVGKLAGKADVKIAPLVERRLAFSDAKKFLTSIKDFSTETDRACVAESVDFADHRLERQRVLAEAWATGDVALLRRNVEPPRDSACLRAVSGELGGLATFGGATVEELLAPEFLADALGRSLEKPGVRLAVVSADSFLSQGGALDVLREQGVIVDEPDAPGAAGKTPSQAAATDR